MIVNADFDVLGLGTILVDHQVVVPEFPVADSKNEVVSHRQQVGGPVPTALAMLQRLGQSCAFIGKWANDTSGEFIARDLANENINATHSIVAAGSTGFAHVWIDQITGSRTVAAWRGDFEPIQSDELPNRLPSCRVLHLDGWSGGAAIVAAEKAKRQNALVFLDTGSPKPDMKSLIKLVDVLSCPERFLHQFEPLLSCPDHPSAAQRLLEMGPSTVVITQGDRGATAFASDGTVNHQSPFPIQAIDTTGAGDVFCGAFIHGLLNEWPLEQTLEFAAATAALKCSGMGNRKALPSLSQVHALIGS